MRISSFIALAGLLFTLTSCSSPSTSTPTAAAPASVPTPIPTEDTSHQVQLLAKVGKGIINNTIYTSDGKYILVAYDTGVGVLKAPDLGQVDFSDTSEKSMSLALLGDKNEVAVYMHDGNIQFLRFDQSSGVLSNSDRTVLDAGVQIHNDGEVSKLSGSPDGKYLAFSANNVTQVWNLETGDSLIKEGTVKPDTYQFSFSADSNYVLLSVNRLYASSNENYLIHLDDGEIAWEKDCTSILAGGTTLMYWTSPGQFIVAPLSDLKSQTTNYFNFPYDKLIFSPDGKLGAMIRWDYGVVLFHTIEGKQFYNYEGYPPKLEYTDAPIYLTNAGQVITYKRNLVTITPGPGLNSTSNVYSFIVLDVYNATMQGKEITPEFEITYPIPEVFSSPDGLHFVYFNRSSFSQVDLETLKTITTTDEITSGVTALTFSPDGKTLVSGQQYFSLSFFDTANGLNLTHEESLQTPGITYRYPGISRWYSGVTGLAFFPDGNQLAANTSNGALNLLTLDGSRARIEINPQEIQITTKGKGALVEMMGLAISPDGMSLATGGYENTLRLWSDINGANPTSTRMEDSNPETVVAYAPGGNLIAAGTGKGFIRLWRTDGILERSLNGHTKRVTGVAFSGDSLISSSEDGTIRFWRIADGIQTQLLELGEPGTSMAVDKNGELVAMGTQSGKTYIWDIKNSRWLGKIPGVGIIRALCFSPDSSSLAIGSESGQIQYWKVRLDSGEVAEFPVGEPLMGGSPETCKMEGRVGGFTGSTSVAGGQMRLEWTKTYSGDCSSIDEKSLREVGTNPDLSPKYSFDFEQNQGSGTNILHIKADITLPDAPGTHKYDWELVAPDGGSFPFSALITIAAPMVDLNLPAHVYYVSDTKAVLRLEKDGQTITPVIEGPVDCMDISPATGEIAYLSEDAIILSDPNGEKRRILLSIGGCPSWSPDGTLIGYTLNGVKVINISTGEIKTLATDLNAYGVQNSHYVRILDWSLYSNKFIASEAGWEYFGLNVFDVPTGDVFPLTGYSYPSWSRNGENIYSAEYTTNYFGDPPSITRTNINTHQPEILMGGSETDLSGGFAPYETWDGRLLVFAGRFADPDAENFSLVAAQIDKGTPGKISFDPNPHPILSPTDVLWWPDGSTAVVKTGDGKIMVTFPFSSLPNIILPIRGVDLRWNTSPEVRTPTPLPTSEAATLSETTTSIHPELVPYTLGYIGKDAGALQEIYEIRADGSKLLRPYPSFGMTSPIKQIAWSADGKSMFALRESGELYRTRKMDNQYFEYMVPEGLPRYAQPSNGGMVHGFSISPNGRYLAVVYTPYDSTSFNVPFAELRLGLSNLGFLDLLEKRWIDVNIPHINSSFEGNAAILLSPNGWSENNQELVVTVTQAGSEMTAQNNSGIAMASYHHGSGGDEVTSLIVVNISGSNTNITLDADPSSDPSAEYHPTWAADGLIYFYGNDDTGNPGLYRIRPDGKDRTRISDSDSLNVNFPPYCMSPDGKKIVSLSERLPDGTLGWAITNPEGSSPILLQPAVNQGEIPVWSPDGSRLAWFGFATGSIPKIFIMNADNSKPNGFNLPGGLLGALQLAWSPDGDWLTFRFNNEGGGSGLYVIRPDGTGIQLVSQDMLEYSQMIWSPVILSQP
jgi:WD40 repeat protein